MNLHDHFILTLAPRLRTRGVRTARWLVVSDEFPWMLPGYDDEEL